jgi:glycosyltransferase involved in cell wall biosynthesis
MRILFVHSGADLYGASRSLLRLSGGLAHDGNAVVAVLPYDGPLRSRLEQRGVTVVIHRMLPVVTREKHRSLVGMLSLLLRVPLSILRLMWLVRKFRPDVVHTNTALILSPGIAAKLCRVPHVWHVREFFGEFPGLWRWYQTFMQCLADRIICVSRAVADQFSITHQKGQLVVLHNGIPRQEWEFVDAARVDDFVRRHGMDGRLVAGVVGRIKWGRKGQEVFIRAAGLLKERFPVAVFALIGSPFPGNEAHLDRTIALVQALGLEGQVVYTGDVDDVRVAYAALDVSVVPSAQPEPFAGVVIESMALGRPVVATRTGGTMEQVEDGVTGLLVRPGDPQALADGLARLLSDEGLRKTMGENGRRRFLERFEFVEFYERMLTIYRQVAPAVIQPPGVVTGGRTEPELGAQRGSRAATARRRR